MAPTNISVVKGSSDKGSQGLSTVTPTACIPPFIAGVAISGIVFFVFLLPSGGSTNTSTTVYSSTSASGDANIVNTSITTTYTSDESVKVPTAPVHWELFPGADFYSGYACENGYVNGSDESRNMDFCKIHEKRMFWEDEYYIGKYLAGENGTCHVLGKDAETAYRNLGSNIRVKVCSTILFTRHNQ